jgi:hypothetical protein
MTDCHTDRVGEGRGRGEGKRWNSRGKRGAEGIDEGERQRQKHWKRRRETKGRWVEIISF